MKKVYLRIPRTGSTSLITALGNTIVPRGKNQQLLDDHINLFDSMTHVPEDEKYLSFTIVRNPYTRAVSSWKFLQKNEKHMYVHLRDSTLESMLRNPPTLPGPAYHFTATQKSLMCVNGECKIQRILRFENLQEEIERLFDEFEIKAKFPHTNQTDSSDYELSPVEKKLIEQFFKEDFEFLSY